MMETNDQISEKQVLLKGFRKNWNQTKLTTLNLNRILHYIKLY
jgi:hypothetical protein